jgi:hypothetical protein
MNRSISLVASKVLGALLFESVFICLLMLGGVSAQAGWQRDMVLGNPAPAQQSAPVYSGPSAEQIAAQQAAQQAAAREAQRQAVIREAHAANDAGLSFWNRHEWGEAVQRFREALAKSPGDKVIRSNLEKATEQLRQQQWQETRKQEDSNMASQMGATLQRLTAGIPDFDGHNSGSAPATGAGAALDFMPAGDPAPPATAIGGQSNSGAAQSQPASWQDPNVVDLRGTTKTNVDPAMVKGKTASSTSDASGLAFMPAGNTTPAVQNQVPVADPNVVDLRGTTKTSVDPATMKGNASNLPAGFRKNALPPPAPGVQLPQNQDMELLMPPPSKPKSAWPGAQRSANEPKLINPLEKEQETKELAKAIFENPAMEDLMLKKMLEDSSTVPTAPTVNTPTPAPASTATSKSAGPHN